VKSPRKSTNSGKPTYTVSMEKHQGPKKGPSARREQRKNHPQQTIELTFFFFFFTLDLDHETHRQPITIEHKLCSCSRWGCRSTASKYRDVLLCQDQEPLQLQIEGNRSEQAGSRWRPADRNTGWPKRAGFTGVHGSGPGSTWEQTGGGRAHGRAGGAGRCAGGGRARAAATGADEQGQCRLGKSRRQPGEGRRWQGEGSRGQSAEAAGGERRPSAADGEAPAWK
jgi:hypothetical protein